MLSSPFAPTLNCIHNYAKLNDYIYIHNAVEVLEKTKNRMIIEMNFRTTHIKIGVFKK